MFLHAVNPTGSTELSFNDVSGGPITVTGHTIKVGPVLIPTASTIVGGDIGRLPQSVVSAIQIQKGKETIFVPLSAYGDLGDVKSVSFNPMARGFRVSLHGGKYGGIV